MTEEGHNGRLFDRVNFNTGAAICCILLGAAIWILTPYQVDEPLALIGQSPGMSPQLFPRIAAVGFMVVGALYLVTSLRMDEQSTFRDLPASAYLNLAVVIAVMIAYVALLRPLGYALSSILVATSISLYYGSRNIYGIVIVGFCAPLAIYYLFTRMLTVSLPPLPWG